MYMYMYSVYLTSSESNRPSEVNSCFILLSNVVVETEERGMVLGTCLTLVVP